MLQRAGWKVFCKAIRNYLSENMKMYRWSRVKILPKKKTELVKFWSAERGLLMILVTCMSAAGQFVLPLIVFPKENFKIALLNVAPPGTIATHVHQEISSFYLCG